MSTRRSLRLRQEQEKQQIQADNTPAAEPAVTEITNGDEKTVKTPSRRGRKPTKQQTTPNVKTEAAAESTNIADADGTTGETENETIQENPVSKTNGTSPAKVLTEIPTNAPPAALNGSISVESIEKTTTTTNGEANEESNDKSNEVEMIDEQVKDRSIDENVMLDESKIDTDVAAVLGIKRGIQKRSRAVVNNGKGKAKRPHESDDDEDEFDEDSEDDMTDYGEFESDPENDSENKTGTSHVADSSLLDGEGEGLNGSTAGSGNKSKTEKDKMRRRLPLSIKELIDYHSSNGKSIKEIVTKINQVCKSEEKVSYGYVQKYLYRKKLEATTAKKARYYRKKYGFVYRRMRRKPVLTEHHRSLRVQWCSKYVEDSFDKDIFIGKTALKPFLASLNQLKGQPQDPSQPKQQTTLHLWGAISRKGASPLQIFDGSLTTAMYLEILLENIVPFIAENFPSGHRFHQDNNPKHSAKLSQEFLASTGINWVKSPPRSHDLNPIELVWTDLIQNVSKRLPKTLGQVVVAVKDYWKTLTPEKCCEFIDKLVDTVPKVIDKNGEWISLS